MMLKLKLQYLWPPHAKSWLIGKDSDAGRDWEQEEKGTTEDEMAGWHHRLNGCEFEWAPGVSDGQGGLAYWDSWGCKELDMTEQLNWTELNFSSSTFPDAGKILFSVEESLFPLLSIYLGPDVYFTKVVLLILFHKSLGVKDKIFEFWVWK